MLQISFIYLKHRSDSDQVIYRNTVNKAICTRHRPTSVNVFLVLVTDIHRLAMTKSAKEPANRDEKKLDKYGTALTTPF